MNNLAKNVLATVCYYDVLDYPLTSFEVWKYLVKSGGQEENDWESDCDLAEVLEKLESGALTNFIEKYQGFYFLKGRRKLAECRVRRGKISTFKVKRLRRAVWFLRFVPFVRMIGITGRLAMRNAQRKSDWDLLVVLKHGKIWTGRTLVTLAVHLMGKRRYGDKIKDRICLNHFITDKSLKIKVRDLFSANEYFFCFPLFGSQEYKRFQIKNRWIKNFKPNYRIAEASNLKLLRDTKLSRFVRKILEMVFDWDFLESWLRKLETKKIENNPKTRQRGSLVDISDEALIFLPCPQGPRVFEKFKKRVSEL